MSLWWAEYAWLGGDTASSKVLIETDGERFSRIEAGVDAPAGATRLPGLAIPGLVNAHSHAFHRALRGRTQAERGSFWTWRGRMYAVASRLQPDSYYRLARATFAEMVLAGITTVGEFHYVHHDTGGVPYPEPTAMASAVASAARDAGIRLTLLDTCYLAGGFGTGPASAHIPLSTQQRRFGDGTAEAWAERATSTLQRIGGPTVRVGAAVHSVRAVPADQLSVVATWAHDNAAPIHVHLSEQPAENADCQRVYGLTPAGLLAQHGVFDRDATAVHATHLSDDDVSLLAAHRASVCFCVTTERDLADGIGPARKLVEDGVALSLGTDSQAVIDLLEEARGLELDERLASRRRGHFHAAELLAAATGNGARSLGWPEAGSLTVGFLADFATIRLDSVRMAGFSTETLLETAVFASTAADVDTVVVGGRVIVEHSRHLTIDDVANELQDSIAELTGETV